MIEITILPEFSEKVEDYRMLQLEADVTFSETPAELVAEMNREAEMLQNTLQLSDINQRPAIAATRKAYKACGKDPNRYRPSQEQLCRRVVRGLGLYQVNSIVDLGNLLSLKTGCALGIFDSEKISGRHVTLGVGFKDEPYTGIGRGELNIEGLPVLRDRIGAFGTPTSDHERTAISSSSRKILLTLHIFGTELDDETIVNETLRLLESYADATNIKWRIFGAK